MIIYSLFYRLLVDLLEGILCSSYENNFEIYSFVIIFVACQDVSHGEVCVAESTLEEIFFNAGGEVFIWWH